MHTPETDAFIARLKTVYPGLSIQDRFRDFCLLAYCGAVQHTLPDADHGRILAVAAQRQKIAEAYQPPHLLLAYPDLLPIFVRGLADGQDLLGSVARQLGARNTGPGEFIPPPDHARALAEERLLDADGIIAELGHVLLDDLLSSGAVALAAADILTAKGYDVSKHLLVYSLTESPLLYAITYVQLAYRGIPALVERTGHHYPEIADAAWTLPAGRFHAWHGHLFPEGFRQDNPPPAPPPAPSLR